VLAVIRQKVADLTVRMTICAATSKRQQEAEALSREADVMIIVGGRNSSNTKKLLETCRLRCERAYQVETPEDVPQGVIQSTDRVAITAGASTPQWLLEQVRNAIEADAD
jgi:4-hydroxy-3-methylbut-2-enyl diphosphate reductase